jgi:hypothetical protein
MRWLYRLKMASPLPLAAQDARAASSNAFFDRRGPKAAMVLAIDVAVDFVFRGNGMICI